MYVYLNMKVINNSRKWVITALICLIIFSFHANANVISSSNDFHSDFKEIENSTQYIAKRGSMPELTSEEKVEWVSSLSKARQIKELEPYFASQGSPLVSYWCSKDGYVEIGLDESSPEKITNSTINEIYGIVSEHYKQVGIDDVPVVFLWEEVPIEDEGTSIENDEEITNQIPGFPSIMLLAVLSLLVLYRT